MVQVSKEPKRAANVVGLIWIALLFVFMVLVTLWVIGAY